MENRDEQDPSFPQETDLSKAQNQQQPRGQSQREQPQGQADYGSAGQIEGQSDATARQRTDIEGGTSTGQASDIDGRAQFVGSQGAADTSSEFIEDDESSQFAKDGKGAAE